MKNKMFKLVVAVMMSVALVASAIDASFNIGPNGTAINTNLINGPIQLLSLEITHAGNAAFAYGIIDSKQTNTTFGPAQGNTLLAYSNGATVTFSSYLTNISKRVTNFAGLGNPTNVWWTTQTYAGLWTYPTTNGATTNNFRRVFSGTLPATAGSITAMPISTVAYFAYGLTWTNAALNTNVVINISYVPAQ